MYIFFEYIEYKFSVFYKTKATDLFRSVAKYVYGWNYCI